MRKTSSRIKEILDTLSAEKASESERIKEVMNQFPQEYMSFDEFLRQLKKLSKGYISFNPDKSKRGKDSGY